MADDQAGDLLDPPVREIRDLVREVVRKAVAPRAAEIDASGEFPEDVRQAFAEAGLFGLPFDAAYGGTGTGTLRCSWPWRRSPAPAPRAR